MNERMKQICVLPAASNPSIAILAGQLLNPSHTFTNLDKKNPIVLFAKSDNCIAGNKFLSFPAIDEKQMPSTSGLDAFIRKQLTIAS